MLFSFQSEAQKSNILIEKGLAYLASSQSTSKGFEPGVGTSIDPDNIYQMSKTAGDWGGAGITALALQAFLQNGHNIDDPLYGVQVTNAINYLLGLQTLTGSHTGKIGNWSAGYETAMAIEALNLALEVPLDAGGYISGTLKTDIQTAVNLAMEYYMQDVVESWSAVSWRYDRYYTSEYSGDMSVNQWVYLALDAVNYTDKDVWNKIYTYLNVKKGTTGNASRIGYQSYNTRPQGMTCAGCWGAVLAGSHGVGAAAALKTEFYNYLETFTLDQLVDPGSIGSNQIYSGGGYYYYLYGFSKAMALNFKENFAGGNWYNKVYTTIESLHKTDGSGNYYWNDWGGEGNNMETALALLCLQTSEVPDGSTLVISLTTSPAKNECLEITINDELGNSAGNSGGTWYTNIPNSEWTSTSGGLFEFTVEVFESSNYSTKILNTCLDTQSAEICYATLQEGVQTSEKCYDLNEILPFTPIGLVGFVNAIGGLNVIIVVLPDQIPYMDLNPEILSINPFDYNQTFTVYFDISEIGNEMPLSNLELYASDLIDQFGNVIPASQVTIDPANIGTIPAGESTTVSVSITTPATLPVDPGLFEGIITIQTPNEVQGVNIELGSPDMTVDPMAETVPYTNGNTTFDIGFTGLLGTDWQIETYADWLSTDPVAGVGNATVTVNYSANGSDMERVAELIITAPGAANPEQTFTLTQEATPYPFFTYADLEARKDMGSWWDVSGSLEEGFTIGLNSAVALYYLNLGDETSTNLPLAVDMFPFYLDVSTVPPDFYSYFADRGVIEGATGWQAIAWEIINGNEPTFYVKVEDAKDQMFSLVDGLQFLFFGAEVYLQIPGTYPSGNYVYSGYVESSNGIPSEQIDVSIALYKPELLSAELIVSEDQSTWETAFGNLQDGYVVRLDELVENYYLDLGEATTANEILKADMFPFYLNPETVPDGFYEYWALNGVVEGATGWQGIMWEIINGNDAAFFFKVDDAKDQLFSLVDGLKFLHSGTESHLTVPGTYPLGSYMYSGIIMDQYDVPSDPIDVMITFASDIDQQIELTPGWIGISSYIIPEQPAMEAVFADIADDIAILINKNGIYWPSQNINSIGDWNTYTGYKAKVLNPATLEMFGTPANTTLELPAGVCYMPMLLPDPISNEIFAEMGSALTYAFNLQDQLLYWPGGDIYTLETLEPGIAYLINLSEALTVDFAGKKSVVSQNILQASNNSPWKTVTNTGNPHLISIDKDALDILNPGDYIGVSGNDGEVFGMAEYLNDANNMAIVAFGDDFTTNKKDGLMEGEEMNFILYKSATRQIYNLEVAFDKSMNPGIFETNGASIINKLKVGTLGIGNTSPSDLSAYPNPTGGLLNISTDNAFEISIFNTSGQKVYTTFIHGNTIVDLTHIERGVYLLRASNEHGIINKKLILK